MHDTYHFEKPGIAPHTLAEQLRALAEKLPLQVVKHQQAWADTIPVDTPFDDDDLDEQGDA